MFVDQTLPLNATQTVKANETLVKEISIERIDGNTDRFRFQVKSLLIFITTVLYTLAL